MRVLADDGIIDANQLRNLHAILGLLDGLRHLPKRHADADKVHSELELQDVLDRHRVDDLATRLREQLHHILLLVLLIDELLADPVSHVLLVLIILAVVNVIKLLIIAKEQVVDNHFDNIKID